jgi:hypothetical protein
MNSFRNNAIAAGVLLIIADLVGFMSLPFIAPLNAPNYLVSVSTNANMVTTAALFCSSVVLPRLALEFRCIQY